MNIIIKQKHHGIAEKLITTPFQDGPYQDMVECKLCKKGTAIPLMIIDDECGEIIDCRPDKAKIWPHDSMSVVLYLCQECGEITAKWCNLQRKVELMNKVFNSETEYNKAMDRIYTTDAILSLNPNLKREYLNTLTINGLHDLEEALLYDQQIEHIM